VIQGTNGVLYGTTAQGGSHGAGTMFKLNANGTGHVILKDLDYFTTGGSPFGRLLKGTDGKLYGTTSGGGTFGFGTVFKLSTDGTGFTVLVHFDSFTTGANPYAGLMQGKDGKTSSGGPAATTAQCSS
jgi:uncharacterized repeat protein (TIGR03803 family)